MSLAEKYSNIYSYKKQNQNLTSYKFDKNKPMQIADKNAYITFL